MKELLRSRPADYRSLEVTEPEVDGEEGGGSNETECEGAVPHKPTLSELSDEEPSPRWTIQVNRGASLFALRMAILLTVGSLFSLIRAPGDSKAGYPQGSWVLVTLLFVSWFPRLDAASVVEKSMQRIMGTLIGAAIGLSCGFISMAFESDALQGVFVGFCVFAVTFVIIFLSGNLMFGPTRIMQRYGYATILCLLTFAIAILPFYTDAEPKWRKGVWRVINVLLGCIIGAVGSVVLWPRSTSSILKEKVAKQVKLAGESSRAVLHAAADAFSGNLNPLALADELLETPAHRRTRLRMSFVRKSFRGVDPNAVREDGDVVLANYADAIGDWRAAKALYPVMPFDPFHWLDSVHVSEDEKARIRLKTARILAQALRIQTMVVCLDGIIRNDMPGVDFDEDHVDFFAQVGTAIRNMLTVPIDESKNDNAAATVSDKLLEIREHIREVSSGICGDAVYFESPRYEGSPKKVFETVLQRMGEVERGEEDCSPFERKSTGSSAESSCTASCILLFLQLVEQLMLRSLRLHQTWRNAAKQMEELAPRFA